MAAPHRAIERALRRGLVGIALFGVSVGHAAPAWAADAAPQASIDALGEDLTTALTVGRDLAGVFAIPASVIAATTACDGVVARLRRCEPDETCLPALVALYDASVQARATASDPFARRALARVTTELGDVLPRLGAASDQARAGRCGTVAEEGAVPARLRLDADLRIARLSPLVTLRGGRRYALRARGIPPATATALAESVVPRMVEGRTEIPPGSLRAPLDALLAEAPAGIDVSRVRETAARVESDANGLPGLPGLAVLQVTFPEPPSGTALAGLRLSFVPASRGEDGARVAVFEVLDGRAGLVAYRRRLDGLSCSAKAAVEADPKAVFGIAPPGFGGLFSGRYPSLDIGGGEGATRILGVAADAARVVDLPYRLAVPEGALPETPLVILVDGHMGSAVRSLRNHAAGLLARGLAVLALELPEHGERDTPDGEFADRFDPVPVNRNLRQSAVDVAAMVHLLRDCGLELPDGRRLRPAEISYLGYSLGAMVGVLAHGIEDRLGPTVLLAGAGDFPGWLMLQLIPRLGAGLVSCVGGPEHGRSCFPAGTCAAPGRCTVDPMLFWLTEGFRPLYTLLSAGADPVEFASRRTGPASTAPVLLLTGGKDIILYPLLATRLSDAYDMRPIGAGVRAGPRSTRLHFPDRGHEMVSAPEVREVAYDFLARGGKHPPRALPSSPQVR